MVFGDEALPVPLFGKDNLDRGPSDGNGQEGEAESEQKETDGVESGRKEKRRGETGDTSGSSSRGGDCSPHRPRSSRPEGISITKYSRADWI
jgi:hypothetical protein